MRSCRIGRNVLYDRPMSPADDLGVGPRLRKWRELRRLSQLALSSATGVSTRHLSCVETGRSAPSRELVLHLARELDVPLREQNQLLLVAGFAPVFAQRPLDDPSMAPVLSVLDSVVERSDPNPVVVVDSRWDLVRANTAALWMCSGVAPELLEPPANVARLSLHPDGLAPHVRNFDEYSSHLIDRLARTAAVTNDRALTELVVELVELVELAAHGRPRSWRDEAPAAPPFPPPFPPPFALPLVIEVDDTELRLFSTIATFGSAIDVTLSELSIETFYPADDATAEVLSTRPWA